MLAIRTVAGNVYIFFFFIVPQLFPWHECNIALYSAIISAKKEHRTFTRDHIAIEGNNSHNIPSGFIWKYSIYSLGCLWMNSIIPLMIPRGAGSILRDDRTQSGSHTSRWCGRHERNAFRLRRQELRRREGTSSKTQPAAELQVQGFMKLLSISVRNLWWKRSKAIWKRNVITAGKFRSNQSSNGGSLSLLIFQYPRPGLNIVYFSCACVGRPRILLMKHRTSRTK